MNDGKLTDISSKVTKVDSFLICRLSVALNNSYRYLVRSETIKIVKYILVNRKFKC